MHSGTTDWLKMVTVIGAIFVAVNWVAGIIGGSMTLLVIGTIVLVIVFAAGAFFAHMNQKMTLDAFNKSSAQDAQIDRYRQQSFKALASGESAMQRAAAQLTVLDAKRIDGIAQQRAKLLTTDTPPADTDTWTWDDDSVDAGTDGGAFQEWR